MANLTRTQLDALFPDNGAREISASDLRALVESALNLEDDTTDDITEGDNKFVTSTEKAKIGTNETNLSEHEADTSNPHSVTKTQIGLSNVDNTSDVSKPISTLTQAALDLKSDNSHSHTASDVGLGNVDNTADADKPISDATQTALDDKAALSHSHDIADVTSLQTTLDAKALKTNVLEKDNTTAFTPSADYHPSTKKYVDDAVTGAGGYNDEAAQDAVGGILSNDGNVDFTYDDATPKITASVDLSGKADASHTHTASEITDFDTEVSNNPNVAANTAKIGVTTELKPADIDTLAELNAIVTDATLIDTTDSRLSDARTPLSHTHTESDITDLQDYLLAADVADFETTTELNARDTNNRSRANHTGTQTASTISDFDTEVSNNSDVASNTTNNHTHSNKALLDTYDQTNANISDAVSKKHIANSDTKLDDGNANEVTAADIRAHLDSTHFSGDYDDLTDKRVELGFAISDETSDLTVGTARLTFRMPYAMTLTAVRANVVTAPTGSPIVVDINEGGGYNIEHQALY